MLSIMTQDGHLLKTMAWKQADSVEFGFHSIFGWVTDAVVKERTHRRKSFGISTPQLRGWKFKLKLEKDLNSSTWKATPLERCEVSQLSQGGWKISSAMGQFHFIPQMLSADQVSEKISWNELAFLEGRGDDSGFWKKASLLSVLVVLLLWFFPSQTKKEAQLEVIPEPIKVVLQPEIKRVQKVVTVPHSSALDNVIKNANIKNQETQRAVQQNLGFLGLLGKKDLKKALGGLPTHAKEVSPGAGPGGKEGSGGEYLVGLGQGVRRATVGNTGVAGLGGIGTKGVGGGEGGYGNTMVGSGEGRTLSKIALSQEMVLEGGLDRSVIQATIAKYLSQVRACYEEELQKQAGLSGQVTMNFMINGEGSVSTAQVGKSSLGNAQVENCIATRMKSWKFPKPVGGVNVKVNYPFLLRPMGS